MIELHLGDCLNVLRAMPEMSVDAIVTDPPYGLSFMGKKWDYDVPSVEIWKECLRVLKPGGHLLSFAGTRTQHRMAVNIEDAGFEIRDMIAWVYGSGFPKSLDISKQLDKMDASEEQERRRLRFTAWVRSTGITSRQIDEATQTNMGGHYTTAASQPAIMTREHLEACRHLLGDIPQWVEQEADIRSVESKNFAEREVVGKHPNPAGSKGNTFPLKQECNITAPATEAARQWNGWGTALKPSLEPVTVARRPIVGTVARNALKYGTGGINVDGCRVGTDEVAKVRNNKAKDNFFAGKKPISQTPFANGGRFPANLIHDGSDEVVGLFPETGGSAKPAGVGNGSSIFAGAGRTGFTIGDSGSAARFFYCAKASKADREGSTHPTMKPTALMRYLCRFVTPPGGIVLDPFMGSGSTGKAAVLEGFNFIGIEREPEYMEIARRRIHAVQPMPETTVDTVTYVQPSLF